MIAHETEASRSTALTEAGVQTPKKEAPAKNLAEMAEQALKEVDAFMIKVGYKNPAERTDDQGWRYFSLGSAEGRAGIDQIEDELFLRVEAPIISLPADKELILPFMRELLEVNLKLAGEVRIGIIQDKVFGGITYPVENLNSDRFGHCIHSVMKLADDIDDMLIKKYGGTAKTRSETK